MKIEISNVKGVSIAEVISDKIVINETQDALDIMAESGYLGSTKIIVHEHNIIPSFFDLKTGIAGDILQKFSTYNVQLAIVGKFAKYTSKSLNDFIYESNKYGRIIFVSSLSEAIERLAK
jgi:hypothetical protein